MIHNMDIHGNNWCIKVCGMCCYVNIVVDIKGPWSFLEKSAAFCLGDRFPYGHIQLIYALSRLVYSNSNAPSQSVYQSILLCISSLNDKYTPLNNFKDFYFETLFRKVSVLSAVLETLQLDSPTFRQPAKFTAKGSDLIARAACVKGFVLKHRLRSIIRN